MTEAKPSSLLDMHGVSRQFGEVRAVDDVSLRLPEGKPTILAIAGESGSGKSTLASMLLGFLQPSEGQIEFLGRDISRLDRARRAQLRREIQAVFQDPFDAFNPFYAVEHTLHLAIDKFGLAQDRRQAGELIDRALRDVRLKPEATIGRYPHQLSGGQLQRIMIARALLIRPRLIVADEPVSMIDASLRAIVLEIMARLRDEHGMSQIYITHDLSSALQICDEIIILYRGMVVERGDAATVIEAPRHPYTQLLIGSIPVPDPNSRWESPMGRHELGEIDFKATTVGCKFRDRCPHRMPVCAERRPPSFAVGPDQQAACFLYEKERADTPRQQLGESP